MNSTSTLRSDVPDLASGEPAQPWWRFPIVWMVVGGPLVVVVAAIATFVIAYRNVDPVLDTASPTHQASLKPALQGRNMAADHAVQQGPAADPTSHPKR